MKQYIKEYMESVDKFIAGDMKNSNAKDLERYLKEFDMKLSEFQHERLIHLLVTLAFAMFMLFELYAAFALMNLFSGVAAILMLILTIAYVFHYYFLENSVQAMYKQRDKIKAELDSKI